MTASIKLDWQSIKILKQSSRIVNLAQMDFQGFYGNNNGSHYFPQRKNSDMLREAQATFSALPHKDAEDLRDFLNKNSDNIRTYDLTEENLRLLKQLRKSRFFISLVPKEPQFNELWAESNR